MTRRKPIPPHKLAAYAKLADLLLAPGAKRFVPSGPLDQYLVPIPSGDFVGLCFDGPMAGHQLFDPEPVVDIKLPYITGNADLLTSVGRYEYSGYGSWLWIGDPRKRWRVNIPWGG